LLPEGYGAVVQIGNLVYDIQHGNNFSYTPAAAGTLDGQITVRNYFVPMTTPLRLY